MVQCLKCKTKFEVVRAAIGKVAGISDYPVRATARYCPFCGDDLNEQQEKIWEELKSALAGLEEMES